MDMNYFRRMFDYTFWANRRVWRCVEPLTEAQFTRHFDYSIGSIHAQLVHQMGTEWLFYTRAIKLPATSMLDITSFPTREIIRTKWDEIEKLWRMYLNSLDNAMLTEPLEFMSITTKAPQSCLLYEALTQAVNHSTDHRAQILSLIHQVGGEPTVPQDFIYYVWNLDI